MNITKLICCVFLLSGLACKHQLPSAQTVSVESQPQRSEASGIKVGMSMADVIKIHGHHYRYCPGPLLSEAALVYDDLTVNMTGAAIPTSARVVSVQPTTPDIISMVGKTPFADEK